MDAAERARLREAAEVILRENPPVMAMHAVEVSALLDALDWAEAERDEWKRQHDYQVTERRNGENALTFVLKERDAAEAELARCREAFFATSARAATLHSALDCLVQEIVEDGVYFTNLADARAALAATPDGA